MDPQRPDRHDGPAPQSRHSKDIDLLIASAAADPIDELRRTVRDHHLDHFRFEVGPPRPLADQRGSTITVTALLGGRVFDTFSIDIVDSRRELVGQVERHRIPRLVDTDDFTPGDQRSALSPAGSDRRQAVRDVRGPRGSWHCVGPIPRPRRPSPDRHVLLPIDLATTVQALERERAVRGIPNLPAAMISPGPSWTAQWGKNARNSPLTSEYHDLDIALTVAGRCYNTILTALPAAPAGAVWDHHHSIWNPTAR